MPKIYFENLGNIGRGEIELHNLTIFSGENNTGKTYAAYALYSLLDKDFTYSFKEILPIIETLYDKGITEVDLRDFFDKYYQKMKAELEHAFVKELPVVFSAEQEEFKQTKITLSLDEPLIKEKLIEQEFHRSVEVGKKDHVVFEATKEKDSSLLKFILLDDNVPKKIIEDSLKNIFSRFVFIELFSRSFLLPAERTGLNLFYQELNRNRTALMHHLQKSKINTMELIKDLIVSRYPQPIADYIDFLNDLQNLKKVGLGFKELATEVQKEILHGKYKIEKEGIYFQPYKNNSNKGNFNPKLSLHLASSTVKTFFSLVFYLEYLVTEGSTLIIDEPELNLHPDNQRKIARILAKVCNRGVRVIVSTHSDYFIRELNNLIMLKKSFASKEEIMQRYGYTENMLLAPHDVGAYLFVGSEISKMEINSEEGIIAKTFDDVINTLNTSSDEIYYTKQAELSDEAID